MALIALVLFVFSLVSFFSGAIGPGIGLLILALIAGGMSEG